MIVFAELKGNKIRAIIRSELEATRKPQHLHTYLFSRLQPFLPIRDPVYTSSPALNCMLGQPITCWIDMTIERTYRGRSEQSW